MSDSPNGTHDLPRRAFLTSAGAALGGGLAGRASAQSSLGSWLSNVSNATEVVDRTGQSTAVIEVGASANGGAFGFAPAVVRVDPETTVRWKWTGKGGQHNVVDSDGAFESDYYQQAGTTFEYVPSETGVRRYFCVPHKTMGMKGALVVGDAEVSLGGGGGGGSQTTATRDATDAGEGDGTESTATPERTFGGWLSETDNYTEVVDRTGQSTVTVEVGAQGNGGPYAFSPPVVNVDPGTEVVWKWVGGGGPYDVVGADGDYGSETVAGKGYEYRAQFDGHGISRYECSEYADRGMRGVVVVGDGPREVLSTTGLAAIGGVAAALGVPLAAGLKGHFETTTGPGADRHEER